ncbi:pentapeptide repeat-containing protein [Actinomadura sp. SCN-SB]|uniref:pentapeptide repeat-containing protein n=1 Tax=Actinomadura sp. SCN-SB TaxID=3373092 RepID=UPI003753615C
MNRPNTSEVVAAALTLGSLVAAWGGLYWVQSETLRWALFGAAAAGVSVLALWALLGPGARWLSGERTALTPEERARLTPAERAEGLNQARQALMQSVTGLVVIVGVVFTAAGLLYTSRTLEVTREGQVTDRYTKAIEQLGSEKSEVRTGGIFALERLMQDSRRDQYTIAEVLSAYVRSHATDRPPVNDPKRLPVDAESALRVLLRSEVPLLHIDLQNIDLRGKNLVGIDLKRAILSGANLSGADLTQARLSNAYLYAANLSDANLTGADLSNMDLRHTNLSGADLTGTDLRGADLRGPSTRGAYHPGVEGWNLGRANLTGAQLNGADLRGADLSLVQGISADHIRREAVTDGRTRFPR